MQIEIAWKMEDFCAEQSSFVSRMGKGKKYEKKIKNVWFVLDFWVAGQESNPPETYPALGLLEAIRKT